MMAIFVCDFCSSPRPRQYLPGSPVGALGEGASAVNEDGDGRWMICDECLALWLSGEEDALAARSVATAVPAVEVEQMRECMPGVYRLLLESTKGLHRRIRVTRTGGPRLVDPNDLTIGVYFGPVVAGVPEAQ